jgi:hypothetical protein
MVILEDDDIHIAWVRAGERAHRFREREGLLWRKVT